MLMEYKVIAICIIHRGESDNRFFIKIKPDADCELTAIICNFSLLFQLKTTNILTIH